MKSCYKLNLHDGGDWDSRKIEICLITGNHLSVIERMGAQGDREMRVGGDD